MGVWEDLKAVALAVHRLTQAEKQLAEQAAEMKAAPKTLREQLQDVRDRQTRIEARLDGLGEVILTKAVSAAQNAATLAFADMHARFAERLARLEAGPPSPPSTVGGTALRSPNPGGQDG